MWCRHGRPNDPLLPGETLSADNMAFTSTDAWKALENHVHDIDQTHLKDLLTDSARCDAFLAEHDGLFLDYARQRMTADTRAKLFQLAKETKVEEKVAILQRGLAGS